MAASEERKGGVEILTDILSAGRILRVGEPRIFNNGYAYYFEVTAYDNVTDFCLPSEILEDLNGTPAYKKAANTFARALEQRLRNPKPNGFLTKGGLPLEIEPTWPREPWHGRAASVLRVAVRDLRNRQVAQCFVVVTHAQQMFELKEDPFSQFGAIVNSVRDAVDAGKVLFYPEKEHPAEFQRVDLNLSARAREDSTAVLSFLEKKVFWLGFKIGSASSLVWIADPWDADYLGVLPDELRREAEILDAREMLRLNDSREFASSKRELLLRAHELECAATAKPDFCTGKRSADDEVSVEEHEVTSHGDQPPTVFVSYSWDSPDHKKWVLRLSERLRVQGGAKVILDQWDLPPGGDRTHFMEHSIATSDFVLVVCTPTYATKADAREGGVGYEAMIITNQLATQIHQIRFIPALRSGNWKSSLPIWIQSKIGVDLSGDPYDEEQYELLLRTVHRAHAAAPPIGPKPVFRDTGISRDPTANAVTAAVESVGKIPIPPSTSAEKPSTIAYSFYEIKGANAPRVQAYVRAVDPAGASLQFESSTGQKLEGTQMEIAQSYIAFDRELRQRGYTRMQSFNGSGGNLFDLPG